METLDSLALALNRFKGGIIVISHSNAFVKRVCTEQWMLEDGGKLVITKGIQDITIETPIGSCGGGVNTTATGTTGGSVKKKKTHDRM